MTSQIYILHGFIAFHDKSDLHFSGALLFKLIEGPHETHEKQNLIEMRENIIDSIWNSSGSIKNQGKFEAIMRNELRKYEAQLYSAFASGINSESETTVWDFWGSMVYSATIYTTIGKLLRKKHCAKKVTIHQVTTMLATSKIVLFPGHNHLLYAANHRC